MPAVLGRPLQHHAEVLGVHIDGAGDEGRLAADGHGEDVQRVVDRAHGRALGHLPQRRSRRVLPLGQPVDAVVEQDDVDVQVAAEGSGSGGCRRSTVRRRRR